MAGVSAVIRVRGSPHCQYGREPVEGPCRFEGRWRDGGGTDLEAPAVV